MAVILILDRANVRGKKRPTIKKIVCDGYMLYTEKDAGREYTKPDIVGNKVSALGMARKMLSMGIGEPVYHELREEMARLASEERKKKLEERRNSVAGRGTQPERISADNTTNTEGGSADGSARPRTCDETHAGSGNDGGAAGGTVDEGGAGDAG